MRIASLVLVSLTAMGASACDGGDRVPLGEQHTSTAGRGAFGSAGASASTDMVVGGGATSTNAAVGGGATSTDAAVGGGATSTNAAVGGGATSTNAAVGGGATSTTPTGSGGSAGSTATSIQPCDTATTVCSVTMELKPYLEPCVGLGTRGCMVARENGQGEFGFFYDWIAGFTYDWGYDYQLRVETSPIPNPRVDASSIAYKMLALVVKTPVADGTEFDFNLAPSISLTSELALLVLGSCSAGYTLLSQTGPKLRFDAGLTCDAFEAALLAGVPDKIRLRFAAPGEPLTVVSLP